MDTATKPTALAVINGAQPLTVKFKPVPKKDANGAEIIGEFETPPPERVLVRLVPLSKAGDYLALVGDLIPFVELACSKPAGWGDTLEDDSVYEIEEIFRKLNDPRFDRYVRRQTEAVGKMTQMAKAAGVSTIS